MRCTGLVLCLLAALPSLALDPASPDRSGPPTAAGSAVVALPAQLQPGNPAPAFSLTDAGGAPVTLASLRGKVVFLHFWATWCAACKETFAWLKDLQQRDGDRGLVVLGIDVDGHRAEAETWLAAHPPGFAVAFDNDFELARSYGVHGMPALVLIGAQGDVQWVQTHYRQGDRALLEARLEALLKPPAPR